jgi:hypothetical protein
MTNFEIDQELANELGVVTSDISEFIPTEDLQDALIVGVHFNLHTLHRYVDGDKKGMWLAILPLPHNWCIRVEDKTAQLAICKAALEVIEVMKGMKTL